MADFIYDVFMIKDKYQLNGEDHASLTKLYLPIMGIDSYTLYTVLNTLEKNKEYTIKSVLDLIGIFTLNSFNQALDKLEGLGLVKTYSKKNENKDEDYLFSLLAPLSKDEFLNDELLYAVLCGAIGSDEVKKLENEKVEYKGYKEKTKKFEDVFDIETKDNKSVITNLIKPNINIEHKDFNYPLFKNLCDSKIPEDVLEDTSFKGHVLKIAFTYKLNAFEMRDVIVKTMDLDKNLEYASISRNARIEFQKKYKVDNPTIKAVNDDEYLSSIRDDAWYSLLKIVDNSSISDILQSISGIKPSVAEIKMFEEIQNNTSFPTGVINMMILVVNGEKEGEIPGYNYFEKIANTWARAKVKTAYDVLKFYENKKNKELDKNKVDTFIKKKKEAIVPSWYEDYKKELKGEISYNEDNVTEEQKQEVIDLVKDLFK